METKLAETEHTQATPTIFKRLLKLLLFVLLVVSINAGATWLTHQIEFQLFPRHDSLLQLMVAGSTILYVLLMAIPFMPGIEIGLALMILLGSKGALLIYLCTVVALTISFIVGRKTPPRLMVKLLDWLHLNRASAVVTQLEPLDQQQRLDFLYGNAPRKLIPFLLQHRYLAIVAILNLPGNALLGGGGGIGIICGMSKIVPPHVFILITMVAVAPVPLLFYLEVFQAGGSP